MQKNQTGLLSYNIFKHARAHTHTHTKYKNSEWIKDLKTVKLLEENTGSMFFDISISSISYVCLLRQGKQKQS